jgi:hypothetical protein
MVRPLGDTAIIITTTATIITTTAITATKRRQRVNELTDALATKVILETGEPRVTTDGLYFWTLSSAVNPNPLPPRVLLRALSDF